MKTRFFRHVGVALASTLVLSSLALTPLGTPAPAQAAIMPVIIDRTSDASEKASVSNAYLNVFLRNIDVATEWNSGDISACNAGETTQDARDATVNVINYYRVLAGLDPVTENTDATARAQQAALLVTANSDDYFNNPSINPHYPPTSWNCYSPVGATSAALSNLGGGYATGGKSVQDYMVDSGIASVGHRAAVLYPPLSQVGVGMVGDSWPIGYALEWNGTDLDTNTNSQGTAVRWPSEGYFPYQSLPSSGCQSDLPNNGCWSYSIYNRTFNGGSGQSVTVTKNDDTTNLVTSISSARDNRASDGAIYKPDATLIWTMPKIDAPAAGTVDTYHVTISGAVTDSYDVKVFTPVQTVTVNSVSITGARTDETAAIGTTLTANATGVSPTDATLTYTWYRGTTQVGTGKTYKTTMDDKGASLTVEVTGTKTDWVSSDPMTSSAVTVDSLDKVSGTVTSTDGSPVSDVVLSYDNFQCDTAHTAITDSNGINHSGTATVTAAGTFSFDAIKDQCYKVSVSTPTATNAKTTVNGTATSAYITAGTTDVPVSITRVQLTAVTIPDSVFVGQNLTPTTTSWPDAPSLTYQWLRDGTAISGATSATYTAVTGDLNHKLSVKVTASNGGGSATLTSNEATVTPGLAFTFTPPIYVDGATADSAAVHQTLTTSIDSVPAGWTVNYQWMTDDGQEGTSAPITGATKDSWTLVGDDANTNVWVVVTLTQDGYGSSTNPSAAVPVKAVYTVTFDARNDEKPIDVSVVDSSTAKLPETPTLQGNVFDHWMDPEGAPFTDETVVTADITVTAVWAPVTHTVAYDANGGAGQVPDTKSYRWGDSVTLAADDVFSLEGSTFDAWNTAADGSGTHYLAGATLTIGDEDVTLYAQWTTINTPPPTTYTVTYDANDGTGTTAVDETPYPANSRAEVQPGFTRDGYTFKEWNTAADGTGTACAPGDTIPITGNVTLYAQWEPVGTQPPAPDTYTVTYEPNGGTGTAVTDTKAYQKDDPITVAAASTFTRTGWTFTGWNTAADGSGTSCSPNATITMGTANLTLYAQWKQNPVPPVVPTLPGPQYTVTYDANGGTGTTAPTSFDVGTQATAAQNGFTRDGYTFVGWNTAKDGTGTGYSVAAEFDLNGNVTLYAQWTVNAPETPANPAVPGGGTSANSSMLLLVTIGLILSGAAILRLRKTA